MNEDDREFKQRCVTCPLCNDVAKYYYLDTYTNTNYRVYKCISNEEHIVMINEDIFWNEKA